MGKPTLNFGILGAATVAPRVLIEPAINIENINIIGIASRNYEKAKNFANKNNIPVVFKNYHELIESDKINAIYITLPNSLHTDLIIKAAQNDKHILVEKPICMHVGDFELIESIVKKSKVILLEALMAQHHAWQGKVKDIIDSTQYGKVKKIITRFTFQMNEPNLSSYRYFPELGGGSFYDLSPYWIQFVQKCTGLDIANLDGKSDFNGLNGIDTSFEAEMTLINGVKSEFYASYTDPYEASHKVIFEDAELVISKFTRPIFGFYKFKMTIVKNNKLLEEIILPEENYYYNQLKFFYAIFNREKENVPLSESFERIKIMEEIYKVARNKIK